MEKIKWVMNKMPKSDDKWLSVMSLDNVEKARAFHKGFPQRLRHHSRAIPDEIGRQKGLVKIFHNITYKPIRSFKNALKIRLR